MTRDLLCARKKKIDECYPTFTDAIAKCEEAGDCGAVATQTNARGGQYCISHGSPHLLGLVPGWHVYDVRVWVLKSCMEPEGKTGRWHSMPLGQECSDFGPTTTTTSTTGCLSGICVSSAACGAEDTTATVALDCNGKSECVVEVTEANSPVSLIAQGFDFDETKWVQKDGYHIYEQCLNFDESKYDERPPMCPKKEVDECYPTFTDAIAKCEEAGDCGAVATQTNARDGQYCISHGSPHLLGLVPGWHVYDVRVWVLKRCMEPEGKTGRWHSMPLGQECSAPPAPPPPPGCKDAYTVSYSCGLTKILHTATLSKPSAGQTTTLSCPSVGTTETTTTIPGGNTNPGGKDCFGAIATFGPDFECNEKVSSFCADDSADGLDVSACCQDYCNSNQEKRSKKTDSEAKWKEAEGERKSKRRESRSKRKDAESARKKKRKEKEWVAKRVAQEISNKKAEDERKTKNGHSESQKKKERTWKANRENSKKKAQRREAARKVDRGESNGGAESTKKNKRAEKKTKWKASRKAKKEKRQKKQGGRKGRKGKTQ